MHKVIAHFFTILFSVSLAAQQRADVPLWVDIAPEVAAGHLLKKVAPIHPPFAKAVGVEGVVRFGIRIYPDGHVQPMGVMNRSPFLFEAAGDAVGQYVYKPFEKDGKPIGVQTTVDVAFVIPNPQNIFRPPPPPKLTLDSFRDPDGFLPTEHLSAEMRDWLSGKNGGGPMDPGCWPISVNLTCRSHSKAAERRRRVAQGEPAVGYPCRENASPAP